MEELVQIKDSYTSVFVWCKSMYKGEKVCKKVKKTDR